jgi:predicted Zn finger-like uncharacterized protein
MFSQCPNCRTSYPVTKKQLRGKKTQLFCSACNKKFKPNILLEEKPSTLLTEAIVLEERPTALLTEAKAEYIPKQDSPKRSSNKHKPENKQFSVNIRRIFNKTKTVSTACDPSLPESTPERLPWESDNTPFNINWLAGIIIGSLLLLAQIIYFQGDALSQNIAYRPSLEKLCGLLGCNLKVYQNLDEFEVLRGSIIPNNDNTLTIKAVINNQAAFKQKLPNIKLTLLDYNGQIIAQRIFDPKDHLPASAGSQFLIAPDASLSVSLTIVAPSVPMGGYNLDLLY